MVARDGAVLFGSTLPPDEAPSQSLLPVADRAVLLLCSPGSDLDEVCRHLLDIGMRLKVGPSIAEAPSVGDAPHHCFVDWSLRGAADYIAELSRSSRDLYPVALVDSAANSAAAYASGAIGTASRPMLADEIVACVRGQCRRRERRRANDAVLGHDQRVSAATAFEATWRTLGQQLRSPLATALANVEYLVDVAQSAVSPMSDQEHLALVTDSLEALQQLRTTLEGMSALTPTDAGVTEQVRLWRVAQRVVDELPNGAPLVELQGDSLVRGWGDESKLVEVASILVKRAVELQQGAQGPGVTLHVYAHDTEARLTVRGHIPEPRSVRNPFSPTRSGPNDAHGGLQLAAVRHAIVKMGGTLSYVSPNEAGSAFRIRLRLAHATVT
jgi:signal transduction histidine kinase